MKEKQITFYPIGSPPVELFCEVAQNIFQKTKGLMYRSSLPNGKGMVFPFWFSWLRFFWMNNVSIPLDIIFISKDLKVVSIFEAPANVGFFNKGFWAYGYCKYVIECNMGFCKNHDISLGTRVVLKDVSS
jgi:hypothetical protein